MGPSVRNLTFWNISRTFVFNPDGSKMSKRDKDKFLRATVNERSLDFVPDGCFSCESWDAWRTSKDAQLETDEATALAIALGIYLPEINVDDFSRNAVKTRKKIRKPNCNNCC